MRHRFTFFLSFIAFVCTAQQQSVARQWNEQLIQSIRKDLARPTVHARNLFHISAAAYDAWAILDPIADPYFVGNTVGGINIPFAGFTPGSDVKAQQNEAVSYAMYRMILSRFRFSPEGITNVRTRLNALMNQLGYDPAVTGTNYQNGSAAELGNYIAAQIQSKFALDGSRENQSYTNSYYTPSNQSMIVLNPGNPTLTKPNRWQPLTLTVFIDQSGNVIPGSTPSFLSAQWGDVIPFALEATDKSVLSRDGNNWNVYLDPGMPVTIDTNDIAASAQYKKSFGMTLQWSSHLGPADGKVIDISPGAQGNPGPLPADVSQYYNFYNYMDGGDIGMGRSLNPVTGLPYDPNPVLRGDYSRVLAEFWADGPESETPPGHWFTLFNYVTDHPLLVKKYKGKGNIVDDLEWDVKGYFMLGGAMHDAAVSTWSIKGYYDYIRPISAIRYMASKGQSTDPSLPHFHKAGLELIPGFVELVQAGDPLAGGNNENVNKIKVKAWRAHDFIPNTSVTADVGWILGEKWWPYQRKSFVTPPFAGYLSGHSTFSRAAAEVLTNITGTEFFPGGMGEFIAHQNQYLVFEEGPTTDIKLQWATYQDAADQSALSRIWGGIHPPVDDIPGRKNGIKVASKAVTKAEKYFFDDVDEDGFYSYEDCDDNNANVFPGATDICDGLDNDCDGIVDGTIDTDNDNIGNECDTDDDGDGVADIADECPRTKITSIALANGCADNDGDGYYQDKPIGDPLYDPDDDDKCIPVKCFPIISGLTFNDLNYNGVIDENEPGFVDLKVKLYKKGNPNILAETTTTDENGKYIFLKDQDFGDYFIEFSLPNGFAYTKSNIGSDNEDSDVINQLNGRTIAFSIDETTQDITNVYAGYYECNYIGSLVWYDIDKDDIADPTENGINGIKVELYRNENGQFVLFDDYLTGQKPGSPSDDGYFGFCAPPGQYYLKVIMPPFGLVLVRPNIGSNDDIDSDITNTFGPGTTAIINVSGGIDKLNIGAGYYPMAQLGNLVWLDENADGTQDENEAKLSNIKVEAFDENANLINTSFTNENGIYNIDYLGRQNYFLKFYPPSGLSSTIPNVSNEETDNDVDNSNGLFTTRLIALEPGDNIKNIDAGFAFGVLPVTWKYINGVAIEKNNIITWATASEINSKEYIVERSKDGNTFEQVGVIKSKNKTNGAHYTYSEEVKQEESFYYRIKQLDFDGKYSMSDAVYIERTIGTQDDFTFTNPSYKNVEIRLNPNFEQSNVILTIVNDQGTIVVQNKVGGASFTSPNLPAGVYFVGLKTESSNVTKKLIIIE